MAISEVMGEALVCAVNGCGSVFFASIDDGASTFSPEFEAGGVGGVFRDRNIEDSSIVGEHEGGVGV